MRKKTKRGSCTRKKEKNVEFSSTNHIEQDKIQVQNPKIQQNRWKQRPKQIHRASKILLILTRCFKKHDATKSGHWYRCDGP